MAARGQFAALLPDRTRVSGPDHSHTLHMRHNLAHWTGMAGEREQLATLIPDRIRICGPDHPMGRQTQPLAVTCTPVHGAGMALIIIRTAAATVPVGW